MSRTKSPFSKITKPEAKKLRAEVSAWIDRHTETIDGLKPEFRMWFDNETRSLFERIDSQDYFFALQSLVSYIGSTVRRMVSGEIVSAKWSPDGSSFELKR